MGCYYIVAYRESGGVSECPIPFPTLEAARFCATLAAFHFGPDYTILVEEEEGSSEDVIEPVFVTARLIPENAASVPRCRRTPKSL
jgi:hypothetical protein